VSEYEALPDVVFDYDGALTLARRLWSLAADLAELMTSRSTAATTALTDWRGPYRDQFVDDRRPPEVSTGNAVVAQLRSDAGLWAKAWTDVMDENNRRRWARHHQQVKNDRNWLEQAGDWLGGGFEDDTPKPQPVDVPASPGFYATGSLVTY
jgi:hypothetical protein